MRYLYKFGLIVCAAAVSAAPFSALAETDMPVVADRLLTQTEQAETITRAQQLLIDLGYLAGKADGIPGPRTGEAIRQFQQQKGLAATGELDGQTMNALEQMQSTVAEASQLQQRLIDLGYLSGKADGIFGERSQAALRLFQTMQGMEASGELDDDTREKLFAADARVLPQRLGSGDRGDEVTALQQRLIQFGFLSGDADGAYGKKTAAGVRRFQQHLIAQAVDANLGIEPTGEATPATRALLMDAAYSSYICDVAVGDEGDEVARVERKLVQLGYMDAQADEVFDDYAYSAIRAFETDAGLAQGPADRTVIDALFSADAPTAAHFVLHDIAYGDRGIAVREAEDALLCSGMLARMPRSYFNDGLSDAIERTYDYLQRANSPQAALFADSARLTVGAQQLLQDGLLEGAAEVGVSMDEESVKRIQRRLHTLFYLSKYGVDGTMGEGTVAAIQAFQQANGLAATGNADAATQRALFSRNAVEKKYPYRVEVDIDNQRVYVYQLNDAGGYDQVQDFICSTGLGDATPRGIFLNGFPANRWHRFKDYKCWAQYSYEIEGNIMFHSVLYDEKDTATLRYGSLYALGSKASHGCIRLRVQDAKWLFTNCKRGSLVIVIY